MNLLSPRTFLLVLFVFVGPLVLASIPSPQPDPEVITFRQAYQRALMFSPNAQFISLEKDISEGKVTQAGLVPNPVFSTEVENVLGSGSFNGAEGMELTLGLSQLIELGGKRAKRENLAKYRVGLGRMDLSGICS